MAETVWCVLPHLVQVNSFLVFLTSDSLNSTVLPSLRYWVSLGKGLGGEDRKIGFRNAGVDQVLLFLLYVVYGYVKRARAKGVTVR